MMGKSALGKATIQQVTTNLAAFKMSLALRR